MNKSELDYDLPRELIAQHPNPQRSGCRLLHIQRSSRQFHDKRFTDLSNLLRPDDVLVVNDSRVVPAKFFLQRSSGGHIEGLWLRTDEMGQWMVLLRGAGRVKIGELLQFVGSSQYSAILIERGLRGEHTIHVNSTKNTYEILNEVGQTPLPHYIHRPHPESLDRQEYQTIFAKEEGSIAAPTAGMHFDQTLVEQIRDRGVTVLSITLHVGAGTFQPVEVDNLAEHVMHSEHYSVRPSVWDEISQAKQSGRRVLAVGTTTTRVLETVAISGNFQGSTNLFIYPPYTFRVVDGLITNFHLPGSTLLALVVAFVDGELIRNAYQYAIQQQYRFFSYGDATFIE